MQRLLEKLAGAFSGGPVYIRLWRDRILLRDVSSGRTLDEKPLFAISRTSPASVLGAGRDAEQAASLTRLPYELVNPFDHPRVVIGDFLVAEKMIRHFLKELLQPKVLKPAPVVVLHPQMPLNGGATQIEVRALQEMALGAGAREVHVWSGRELGDGEIRFRTFLGEPGVLQARNAYEIT